jgi:cytochrome c oxidase subunit IV
VTIRESIEKAGEIHKKIYHLVHERYSLSVIVLLPPCLCDIESKGTGFLV